MCETLNIELYKVQGGLEEDYWAGGGGRCGLGKRVI